MQGSVIMFPVKLDNINAVETYWWWLECSALSKVYLHDVLLTNGLLKQFFSFLPVYFILVKLVILYWSFVRLIFLKQKRQNKILKRVYFNTSFVFEVAKKGFNGPPTARSEPGRDHPCYLAIVATARLAILLEGRWSRPVNCTRIHERYPSITDMPYLQPLLNSPSKALGTQCPI